MTNETNRPMDTEDRPEALVYGLQVRRVIVADYSDGGEDVQSVPLWDRSHGETVGYAVYERVPDGRLLFLGDYSTLADADQAMDEILKQRA